MWFYEVASGGAQYEGFYQPQIIQNGLRWLTPQIMQYADWSEGKGTLCFHLIGGRAKNEMDGDGVLRTLDGDYGPKAQRIAQSIPEFFAAIRNACPTIEIMVYNGGWVVCENMRRVLVEEGDDAYSDRLDRVLDYWINAGVDHLAFDNSSGLDEKYHLGMEAIRRAEQRLAPKGGKVYVEGFPNPLTNPCRAMLSKPCIGTEPNWTAIARQKGVDLSLLKGEVVRLYTGHWKNTLLHWRNNAFRNDPRKYLADVTARGHRLGSDLNGLTNPQHMGCRNVHEFRELAGNLAADAMTKDTKA